MVGGILQKHHKTITHIINLDVTISGDSTSHRNVNWDARHLNYRAPDYSTPGQPLKEQPSIRLVGVNSSADHSSQGNHEGWLAEIQNIADTYKRAPLSQSMKEEFTPRVFAEILRGAFGDHAAVEKASASLTEDWKTDEIIRGLGDDQLHTKAPADLVVYLMEWNKQKVERVGGLSAWEKLSEAEKAAHDVAMLTEIQTTLGKEAFTQLTEAEQRRLKLFIWAGCCMHKDQNSFKGGNDAMMKIWERLKLTPPMLLANKQNAAILRNVLDPSTPKDKAMDDLELAAFESSTRGGAKATAIAGAIFNNKDDKKGQGDSHEFHLAAHIGKPTRRFPKTNQTRFGSHGEAAAVLLTYLEFYRNYLLLVKDKKKQPAWTNIQLNLYNALDDEPTLTELAAMTLYWLAVTIPYMRVVRGADKVNVLELGPFHQLVREFLEQIIRESERLVSPDASYEFGSLDGKEWELPEAMHTVQELMPRLKHLVPVTVEFFKGALGTWIRFTAEFAPGGLIDMASEEERTAAWGPATNDVNEGILGSLRVAFRKSPTMTAHRFNAQAKFWRNDTQAFIDATFREVDHVFVMREARRIDSSGLEAKRKAAQVKFDRDLAELKRQKDREKKRKLLEVYERLKAIRIISKTEILTLNVKKLDDQLDALRQIEGDLDIPKSKVARGRKGNKQGLLNDALTRRTTRDPLARVGDVTGSPMEVCEDDWEDQSDLEYDLA